MPGGVSEVTADNKALTDIQIQLARIEETIKPLSTLPVMLQDVKDVAKDALARAEQANTRLEALEPAKDVAEDAQRQAVLANKRLDSMEDNQKWFKRVFYGVFITAAAGGIVAAVMTAVTITAN